MDFDILISLHSRAEEFRDLNAPSPPLFDTERLQYPSIFTHRAVATMPNFGLPDLDMSEFEVSNLDMSTFDFLNFGMTNYGTPANEIALEAFQWPDEADLTADFMSQVVSPVVETSPFQSDLDIIDDLSVPSADKEWIFDVLLNEAIAALEHRAALYGWSGTQGGLSDLAQQRQSGPQSIISISPSVATPVQQGDGAKSQLSPLHEHEHPLLQAELVVTPAFEYKGLIQNMNHFTEVDNAYERHVKRTGGAAPEDDMSWPTSSEKQRGYIQQLFGSITDVSDFFELRKARERLSKAANVQQDPATLNNEENPRKRRRGRSGINARDNIPARPKGISKTDWALVDAENSSADLLDAVIHHQISGVEIELLCWRLLVFKLHMLIIQ
ncbi:hypothetical protein SGCOL_008132 [Colletotrichum sp. CLE4]